ncbi:hypothetical protein H310_02346 [Aphanomyces invadans]|uniref:Uncharacterized protein n=1 Tax=Aphanomyces invadans TaxID=157072 RepID=A0A024UNV2_9STRA|nr:hypothetical protein H310_02346 [Aphanomyces invadans]ETW07959.1 hypothetical protein H310_02346 [Aphanomyces invadans]|eukprot:XP_008864052.1 hypothetical protein H310_02346 [Aphanomyces invadans]
MTSGGNGGEEKLLYLFTNNDLWDVDDADDTILREFSKAESLQINVTKVTDDSLNTFAHMAALWDRPRVLEHLIRVGADLNATNKVGNTPADVAMHWGNADLALQIKHYGGKHCCEQERDLAIAQRDFVQSKIDDALSKMEKAVGDWLQVSKDKEDLRIERDRLLFHVDDMERQMSQVKTDYATYRGLYEQRQLQVEAMRLEVDKLRATVADESQAKQNALQGWQKAERYAKEVQHMREIAMQCEEEAVRMRDDAVCERDAARELTKKAQADHVVAVTLQRQAEAERDVAFKEKDDAIANIRTQIEQWAVKVKEAEHERAMIQVEINRQKASLEAKCKWLEKELARVNLLSTVLESQLGETTLKLTQAQTSQETSSTQLEKALRKTKRLENELKELIEARTEEKKMWKVREQQALHIESQHAMQTILRAAMRLWTKLANVEWIFDFVAHPEAMDEDVGRPKGEPREFGGADGMWKSPKKGWRPQTTHDHARPHHHRHSTPQLLTPLSSPPPLETKASAKFVEKLESIQGKVKTWMQWCKQSLDIDVKWDKALLDQSAQNIDCLLTVTDGLFDFLGVAMKDKYAEFRKHVDMQVKNVERKEVLLKRFTQHREESARRAKPAQFRECSIGPG